MLHAPNGCGWMLLWGMGISRCAGSRRHFFAALLLGACSASQSITLYPIQGPLSAQRTLPDVTAHGSGRTEPIRHPAMRFPQRGCSATLSKFLRRCFNVTLTRRFVGYKLRAG
jgi:hypothetical protein